MTLYRNKEELESIMSALWDDIFNDPNIVTKVSNEKLIVKFKYSDFQNELFIDLSGDLPKYYWNPGAETPFDVEMILSSDTAHKFWMEDLNVPMAIATRKIIAKGSVPKALKLLPALKPAFALYPSVAERMGRKDLLDSKKQAGVKKFKGAKSGGLFSIFKTRRHKNIDFSQLPEFPLSLSDEQSFVARKSTNLKPASMPVMLETMLIIRSFESHLAEAFKKGELPTEAIHLSIGQESVAAAVCLNLRASDYLNTTHRGHGHIIAKGGDLKRMMAELYGKRDGLCKGKGGSMHVTDGSLGILGANGIVGAGYLLALGAAFSIKHYHKSDDISVVIAGDGSTNQGMFHEAMNMIALLDLPVLVVVENNLYGEFTHVENHAAEPEIHKRASAYRMESCRIDSSDPERTFKETADIINNIRSDGHPRLLEMMTYRWHGHMEGDGETYRDGAEKKRYQQADPIKRLKTELIDRGELSRSQLVEIEKTVENKLSEAIDFAARSDLPDSGELLTDIYSPDPPVLYEGSIDAESYSQEKNRREMSVAQAINTALVEEMRRDPGVFLWGEDVSLGGYFNVTDGLVDEFGKERIIDTPISENAFVGGAVGAAMTGMRPVSELLFADFLTCCMDPILNQAAKIRYMTGGQVAVPITIRTPLGSGIGMAAQHSQSMERFFYGIPGLIVVAPSDPFTSMGLLKSAIRSNNPVLFFEHKLMYPLSGELPAEEYTLPIGKARVIRKGAHVTIVTFLLGIGIAQEAASVLAEKGIEVEIIDLLTLYPLDDKTILESVKKTGHLLTLEEGTSTGSIGSEVISRVCQAGWSLLKRPPIKVAAMESPVPYAKNLETLLMPSIEAVVRNIEKMFS
jgi:2-oxoisovalerate dehydrogenase E1 component